MAIFASIISFICHYYVPIFFCHVLVTVCYSTKLTTLSQSNGVLELHIFSKKEDLIERVVLVAVFGRSLLLVARAN